MKKLLKIFLIMGGIFTILGAGFAAAGFAVDGFDIERLYPQGEFEKKEVVFEKPNKDYLEYSMDYIEKIKISSIYDNIKIKRSEDDKTRFVYYVSNDDKVKYVCGKNDGKLNIQQFDEREWYEKISFKTNDAVLYIPDEEYYSFTVDTVSGDISIDCPVKMNDNTLGTVELNSVSGNIKFGELKMKCIPDTSSPDYGTWKELEDKAEDETRFKVKSVSGDIDLENINIGYRASIRTTSGNINLKNLNAYNIGISCVSGDIVTENINSLWDINIKTTSGNIRFNKAKVKRKIYAQSVSGEISGKIGYKGNYNAMTRSGNIINIPVPIIDNETGHSQDIGGQRYQFVTHSGDIDIKAGCENEFDIYKPYKR